MKKPVIRIKRVYEKALKKDGVRILVDRLWPRGLTKQETGIDDWAKVLAPSVALRKWFGHDPDLWIDFQKMYRSELKRNRSLEAFCELHQHDDVITLLYAAQDTTHNHALVLQQYLEQWYESLSR